MRFARELGTSMIICGAKGPHSLKAQELKAAVAEFTEKMKPHIGVAEEIASWFPPRLCHHLAIAIPKVLSSFPEAAAHPALHTACEWLTPRLGVTGDNQFDFPISK